MSTLTQPIFQKKTKRKAPSLPFDRLLKYATPWLAVFVSVRVDKVLFRLLWFLHHTIHATSSPSDLISHPSPQHTQTPSLPPLPPFSKAMQRGLRHLARCGVKTVHTASRWNGTAPPQQQQQPPTPEDQAKLAEKIATSRAALEKFVAKEPVSRTLAWAKLYLAQFLLASGDKEGASRELIEGLAVQKQVEPDTLSYARNCIFVAGVLGAELNRHDEAAVVNNEAIAIHKKIITETTDPKKLSEMYSIVMELELQKGEYDAAEISFEKWCKQIVDMNLTEEDTKLMLARKHCAIASLFRLRNEDRRAAKHYMKAIPILETYAPEDELTANAMCCYSYLVLERTFEGVENAETKKATELDAIRMCHKSLDMKVTKPGSKAEANICNVLGWLYHVQGLLPRALEFRERTLKIQDAVGPPDFVIASTLSTLVPLYKELGRMDPKELSRPYSTVLQEELENGEFDEAEIASEKCCKNIAKVYGTDAETKLMIARKHFLMASFFHLLREGSRALTHFMKAVLILVTHAPEDEFTAGAVFYYCYLVQGGTVHVGTVEENAEATKIAELFAIKMCHKSLNITQGIKRGSMTEADICTLLGHLYHKQGLFTRALEFGERALKICDGVDIKAPDTVVVDILYVLVLLYKELGRTEDAERTEARMKTLMATA